MKMNKDVDKEEMKKCLQDANIYEENMSEDLMAEYYEAIKNSETSLIEESQKDEVEIAQEAEKSLNDSANELLEAITNSESVAPSKKRHYVVKSDDDDSLDSFSQDILQKPVAKVVEEEDTSSNNNNNNDVLIDNKQEKVSDIIMAIKNTPIGFNDMPKSQRIEKDMLKIISHELKFINIQNNKKFLTANSENRIKMLYDYHVAAAKLRAHYASLSCNMVPIGKPITAIDHDLYINPVITSLKQEDILPLSGETTYISRSGRLTKRKVYNEFDDSSLDAFSNTSKRSKNDDDWKTTSKTAKSNLKRSESEEAHSNNNSVLEKVSNKSCTKIKRSESPDSSQDVTLSGFIDEFDDLKEGISGIQQKPRTYNRKTPSNEEIMSRSTLFRDSNTPKRSRGEALLNAAKEKAEKARLQEEEIIRFTNTLDAESQNLDDESEKIIVDVEEVVERKRVVPPLPYSRKPIHGRKRGGAAGPEPLNISAKRPYLLSTEEVNSSTVNGVGRRTQIPKRTNNNNGNRSEPSSSNASKAKKDLQMMPCPLCSVSFPQKEIEEHAATCGEDMFPQTAQMKRITCEVCDTIVPFTTDYEVHVKACIAKKNSGGPV